MDVADGTPMSKSLSEKSDGGNGNSSDMVLESIVVTSLSEKSDGGNGNYQRHRVAWAESPSEKSDGGNVSQ